MIYYGQVLKATVDPYHRWVVLNDPSKHQGKALFINLTTLKNGCIDEECILDSTDYDDLDRRTTVVYSGAGIAPSAALQAAWDAGNFRQLPDMPQAALQKMLEGARKTTQLSDAKLKLLS